MYTSTPPRILSLSSSSPGPTNSPSSRTPLYRLVLQRSDAGVLLRTRLACYGKFCAMTLTSRGGALSGTWLPPTSALVAKKYTNRLCRDRCTALAKDFIKSENKERNTFLFLVLMIYNVPNYYTLRRSCNL